jgi:hypothetical protein
MKITTDQATVQEAGTGLERLTTAHPELLGQSTADDWEAILKAKTGSERQKALEAKRKAEGYQRVPIWIHKNELVDLRQKYPGPRGGIDWPKAVRAALQTSTEVPTT